MGLTTKYSPAELTVRGQIPSRFGPPMDVYTTEPGVQVYTDNFGQGEKGQNGATFPRRSAICFEAQHFPDTPNHPYFPSVVLKPGRRYKQKTIYQFGVRK